MLCDPLGHPLLPAHPVQPRRQCRAHEETAESGSSIDCLQSGPDLSLRAADDVAHWIDGSAAFRAGMTLMHEAAASLIDAVVPDLAAGDPLELAA